VDALSECPQGSFCGPASAAPLPCGGPSVYCPRGSPAPLPVIALARTRYRFALAACVLLLLPWCGWVASYVALAALSLDAPTSLTVLATWGLALAAEALLLLAVHGKCNRCGF
jgi:hypothetical protein